MTVARMHKQRKVTRGRYVPRFSKQKSIKRGGGDSGGTPQPPDIVALESFAPTTVSGAALPVNLVLTGQFFQTGEHAPVAIIFKEDAPLTGSMVAMTFTVDSDTQITVPLAVGNGPVDVPGGYSISVGDGFTGSNFVGGFTVTA